MGLHLHFWSPQKPGSGVLMVEETLRKHFKTGKMLQRAYIPRFQNSCPKEEWERSIITI